MSFVIAVFNRSVIVLASDSRQTVMIHTQTPEGKSLPPFETIGTDFMPKIFLCPKNNVGIATHGDVILEGERIDSVIPRFFQMEVDPEDSVYSTTKKLQDFFTEHFPKARTSFYVAGFETHMRETIPFVYSFTTGGEEIRRINYSEREDRILSSCSWGGEGDVLDLLLNGWTVRHPDGQILPVPKYAYLFHLMGEQDMVAFAEFAVRTTIDTIRFQARKKNVGGPIQLLLLTPSTARFIHSLST